MEIEKINEEYVIEKMLPRKNCLIRPYISNLDQLVIVISTLPKPDFLLIDKLVISCAINNINPILVVNKSDIVDIEFYNKVKQEYKHVIKHILLTSTFTGEGIKELKKLLENNLTAFTGQSAVGKTSLINKIFPGFNLKTGELSKKLKIGKNTTRDTVIYPYNNNTLIADTPGFNMLHFNELDYKELKNFYPEFNEFSQNCRFSNCTHVKQEIKNCGIMQALEENKINKERFDRYLMLYDVLYENWRRKYD